MPTDNYFKNTMKKVIQNNNKVIQNNNKEIHKNKREFERLKQNLDGRVIRYEIAEESDGSESEASEEHVVNKTQFRYNPDDTIERLLEPLREHQEKKDVFLMLWCTMLRGNDPSLSDIYYIPEGQSIYNHRKMKPHTCLLSFIIMGFGQYHFSDSMRFSHRADEDGTPIIILDIDDPSSSLCLIIKPFKLFHGDLQCSHVPELFRIAEKPDILNGATPCGSYSDLKENRELGEVYYKMTHCGSRNKWVFENLAGCNEHDWLATARPWRDHTGD